MSREQNRGIAQIWSIVFVDFALPMLGARPWGNENLPEASLMQQLRCSFAAEIRRLIFLWIYGACCGILGLSY